MSLEEMRLELREKFERLKGKKSNPEEYVVKYIDLTTGRTHEKKIMEREMYDLYKLQREGKTSIVSIHRLRA